MNLSVLLPDSAAEWLNIAACLIVFGLYDQYIRWIGRHAPMKAARSAHAAIRSEWVRSVLARPGSEILVVQTLRNSVMAASFMATTAMLALSGTLTLAGIGSQGNAIWKSLHNGGPDSQILAAKLLLLAGCFLVSFVFTAMSVRFFNHTAYVITGAVGSEEAHRRMAMAIAYLNRAGNYYSHGLRAFFACIPFIAGLFSTKLLLPATLILVFILYWFDRVPQDDVEARR